MNIENVTYPSKNCTSKGFLAFDSTNPKKRPAILIAHTWKGADEFIQKKTLEVAKLGYIAFAVDLYGDGKTTKSDSEAASLMKPLFLDRTLLQERMVAAFDYISNHPLVEPNKIGAIGFCFGGLCVIELLRTGVNLAGGVTFHGVLGDTSATGVATPGIRNSSIKGSLLVLTGFDDPLVPPSDIAALEKEMNEKKVDWQINVYSQTTHAFMNEDVHKPESGMSYNLKTAKRAWQSMINFFNEIFGKL